MRFFILLCVLFLAEPVSAEECAVKGNVVFTAETSHGNLKLNEVNFCLKEENGESVARITSLDRNYVGTIFLHQEGITFEGGPHDEEIRKMVEFIIKTQEKNGN